MKNNRPPASARNQQGAALIVVLLLLLAMTMLGLASLRGTIMEERMSANMYDRSLAFQAAEAALREAESMLLDPTIRTKIPASGPTDPEACDAGLCSTPKPVDGYVERVDRDPATFQGWVDATQVSGLAGTPEYFVEYMGDAPSWPACDREIPRAPTCMRPRYRITARSQEEGRAEVVLQSSYAGS